MPRPKRQYSDEERTAALVALDANGGNMTLTASQIGIPLTTIREWRDGHLHPSIANLRTEKRTDLADRLENIAHCLVDDLAKPKKIAKASVRDVAVGLGIVVDKMRLLRELPTSINGKQELTDDEFAGRLQSLADRIRARADAARGAAGVVDVTANGTLPAPVDTLPRPSDDGLPQQGS